MSKKNEVTHAAAPSPGAIASPADLLVARFNSEAGLSVAAGVTPSLKPRVLARAAKRIAAIPKKNPKLDAALVAGKFDPALLAAIGTLGLAVTAALKPTPPNRATTKLLTPAQKQTLKAAGARLGKAIDAVTPVARALRQLEAAKALGRASDVGESPENLKKAIETFQTAAPGLIPLLDDAGVDEEYRAAIARDLADVEAIADSKDERLQEKNEAGRAILEAAVALDIALLFLRGRVNSRLQADPASQLKALEYLPRKPERRKKPTATSDDKIDETDGDETDADETGKDETDADETGKDETDADETGKDESDAKHEDEPGDDKTDQKDAAATDEAKAQPDADDAAQGSADLSGAAAAKKKDAPKKAAGGAKSAAKRS